MKHSGGTKIDFGKPILDKPILDKNEKIDFGKTDLVNKDCGEKRKAIW